ncbi:MAG: hypothetical protein ACXWJD_10025 [Burkholderiaceae bacterium]
MKIAAGRKILLVAMSVGFEFIYGNTVPGRNGVLDKGPSSLCEKELVKELFCLECYLFFL